MASKVLIIDAVSPIGQAVYRAFESSTYAILAPVRGVLDWCDAVALKRYIVESGVSIIVNTAGWHESPTAEQQQELLSAAEAVAAAAKETNCVVIHLSSYRVFGGENQSSYDEQDVPSPLGTAGYAFLQAEKIFERELEHCICLRLSWVLSVSGNFVFHRLLKDLTTNGPELEVTHQRRGAPVSTVEIGRVILAMVKQIFCGAENWGVIHLASIDPCSSAEITEVVAEILDRKGALKRSWRVERIPESEIEAQIEPDSAALTVRRCRDNFGYQVKSWRQGLSPLIGAWLEQQSVDWG